MKQLSTAVLTMLGVFAAFSPLQAQALPCTPNCPEITYVELTGGSFTMGDTRGVPFPVATPPTEVTVNDFLISRSEVTVAQYKACVDAGVCSAPMMGQLFNYGREERADHPVNGVSWAQAMTFAEWVGARLPSESEWEYAARSGGQDQLYPWGDTEPTCDHADFKGGHCGAGTSPVCSHPLGNSAQGVCDLAGGLWEWVADDRRNHHRFLGSFNMGQPVCLAGSCGEGPHKVYKGGAHNTSAELLYAFARSGFRKENQYHAGGFRLAQGEQGGGDEGGEELAQGDQIESVAEGVTFHERVINPVDGVGEPFLLMETEVTQELYLAVMGENPSFFIGIPGADWGDFTDYGIDLQRPVETVSWEEGIRFANALSTAMGLQPAYDGDDNDAVLIEGANGFRYPLDAEWIWAARCGEDYEYAGSDNIDDVAWCGVNSDRQTYPVGLKQANACGLKDMSGNVGEWAADDHDNPGQHRPGAAKRVYRGAGWARRGDGCRLSYRIGNPPVVRWSFVGLRFSRSLD
jgi:formylglycine-generating enzyme required for sulfatase activity